MCAQTLLVFAAVDSNHFVVKNSDFVVDGNSCNYNLNLDSALVSDNHNSDLVAEVVTARHTNRKTFVRLDSVHCISDNS